jgi:hypothetical protein
MLQESAQLVPFSISGVTSVLTETVPVLFGRGDAVGLLVLFLSSFCGGFSLRPGHFSQFHWCKPPVKRANNVPAAVTRKMIQSLYSAHGMIEMPTWAAIVSQPRTQTWSMDGPVSPCSSKMSMRSETRGGGSSFLRPANFFTSSFFSWSASGPGLASTASSRSRRMRPRSQERLVRV